MLILAVSGLFTWVAVKAMRFACRKWKLERPNFQGRKIPVGFGFILTIVTVLICLLSTVLALKSGDSDALSQAVLAFPVTVLIFGVIGLIDDIYGTREAGGFLGHIGLLRQGKLSTGFMKAVIGGIIALGTGTVMAGYDITGSLVNALLIALSANLLNLLDLRPGRAVSCFWVWMIALAAFAKPSDATWFAFAALFVPALWLTVQDRSARIMLGDAGSNVLGAMLGMFTACSVGITGRIVIVVLLICIHLYTEKYSISKFIEKNRILRKVDRMLGVR
jgi:UDP-GlcNAc:undecaprenyl-phosphate GlcNAc-1-phosphate transferase